MGVQATVVFTDLHGSTAVFEALGNAQATEAVTKITQTIGSQCEANGGRVVKTLGDGVLVMFNDAQRAIKTVVELQRSHFKRMTSEHVDVRMPVRIGLATGDIELVAGDCYGDAVNVAARLCDLCGPNQIWASADSVNSVDEAQGVKFRVLGPINIRGRAEPVSVYQVEWREEEASEFLTMQAVLDPEINLVDHDSLGREIELECMGNTKHFRAFDLPIHIGRVRNVEFAVNDPRVSRAHARLEWRNGSVVLVDVSTYGSWVRFHGTTGSDILLRREECVLHGSGELALGASFADATVPKVSFKIS